MSSTHEGDYCPHGYPLNYPCADCPSLIVDDERSPEEQLDDFLRDESTPGADEDGNAREVLDRPEIEKRFLAADDADEVFRVFETVEPPSDPAEQEHLRAVVLDHLKGFKIRTKAIDQWLAEAKAMAADVELIPYVPDPPALAFKTDILDAFGRAIAGAGLVGEKRSAKLFYLCSTTRMLSRPVSGVGKGQSASGKSETLKRTLVFQPPEAYFDLTAMSEKYLIRSRQSFKHRHVVIYEAAASDENSFQDYVVRSLLSEGRIKYGTVDKGPGGELVGVEIEKEGPTGLFTTTTRVSLHPENETRLLSILADDSPGQTKAIMYAIARDDGPAEVDVEEWHALQRWIAQNPITITIPFAETIAERMPPMSVRLRRDFGAVMSLVRAHTLLHMETRERDELGRLVATPADYEAVRDLMHDVLGAAVGASVSETTRKTVEAVAALQEIHPDGVRNQHLADYLKLDKSTVSSHTRKARADGYIEDHGEGRGKPNKWKTADPLPEEQVLLPPLDGGDRFDGGLTQRFDAKRASDQGGWTVGRESGGSERGTQLTPEAHVARATPEIHQTVQPRR